MREPASLDKNETRNNWPQYALTFNEVENLSDEDVLTSILHRHNLLENDIFNQNTFLTESKFSKTLMTKVVLFRLEGFSWDDILSYVDYFFQNVITKYDDYGETDLKSSLKMRFSNMVSRKTKELVKFNQKNFLFRVTALFNFGEKNRLKHVLSKLLDSYYKVKGESISLQDVFKKIPMNVSVGSKFNFLDICDYMYLKACLKLQIDYSKDRRLSALANMSAKERKVLEHEIVHYFTQSFRDAFLSHIHLPKV